MQVRHLMKLKLAGLMLSAVFGISAQAATADTKAEVKVDTTAVAADKASNKQSVEKIVSTVCAACHALTGNSLITLNPKLAGQHPEYLDKQLTEFKSGKRANAVMSGMASMLSEDDMKNLAAYFASQNLTLGQAKTNGAGSLGEKIYRGGIAATNVPACAACHGATGAGLPKQFPRLAGQHADYTLAQLRTFRTGERANAPMMMAIATKMTDAEMAAVADYIQGLR
ncbi:MAG: c-type cytochrome [Betaproteobacteria bacterium]